MNIAQPQVIQFECASNRNVKAAGPMQTIEQINEQNARYRNNRKFEIIDLASGNRIGEPCGKSFAEYICKVRNLGLKQDEVAMLIVE